MSGVFRESFRETTTISGCGHVRGTSNGVENKQVKTDLNQSIIPVSICVD